jgi:F0F1-type ATP synthase membrane subunit b/b'
MPKTPMDYSKTIIYKIVCNDLSIKDCYVGHTTDMTKRKCSHKSHCNNENDKAHNLKIYQIIRENGGWDNWTMVLVEKFPCKDKYEACKREREVYEELEAKMNTFRPYRTQEELKQYKKQYREERKEYLKQYREEHKEEHKEYHKQYREEHKAEHKEYHKQYYQEHKEEINEKLKEKVKEKVECKYCSKLLLKLNMSRHHKTCKSKPVKE